MAAKTLKASRVSPPVIAVLSRATIAASLAIVAWLVTVGILGGRVYFLNPCAVSTVLEPALEPFGIGPLAMAVAIMLAGVWFRAATQVPDARRAFIYLVVACLPLVPWLLKLMAIMVFLPTMVEALWLATWTGLSFRALACYWKGPTASDKQRSNRPDLVTGWLWLAIVICASWWYCQLCWYHENFLLGYNDYGHFLLRLHNTLQGKGILVESPVLPRFWDHFNPGLLLWLPLWSMWPDVHQSFVWQSLTLAASGYLIFRIALALGHDRTVAGLFGIAWLAHPVTGQMNLGYSYGWHPITPAIPLLLATIWALLAGRRWWALVTCTLALSMEEGVFVIVALSAFCCAAGRWYHDRRIKKADAAVEQESPLELSLTLNSWTWLLIGLATAVLFVIIYKTSGLAEFQSGRFASLGSNTTEILLSPFRRPLAFWIPWLSMDRWLYVAMLVLPIGVSALKRGWLYCLPTILPLAVLTAWDHLPAHCICFQYAATLMPLLWLAAMTGAKREGTHAVRSRADAVTACTTSMMLSLFIGQLPYSTWTLLDVDVKSYGSHDGLRRRAGQEDGLWLAEQLQQLRAQPANCLATGRIAAHLVGMPDVETVGQYLERREQLSRLQDRPVPIRHYRWIVLDRAEAFQQAATQIQSVETEARAAGFVEVASQYNMVILQSRP